MKKLIIMLLVLTLAASCACAELFSAPTESEAAPVDTATTELTATATLPIDFSAGHKAPAANFTDSSYADDSITVTMEHVWVDDARYNVAHVKIADASQLRTALAADFGKTKTNKISTIAKNNNAIVAIGGDYYSDRNNGYVVRQGQVYRTKLAKTLDILFVDQKGDFHIILSSNAEELKALLDSGATPINVFNFGPALVVNGQKQDVSNYSNFNPKGKEPRCAIGQVGPLEYVLVVVDGRKAAKSAGCSMTALADFMAKQGCTQAFNLDGGNSSLMVFNNENYSEKSKSAERSVSDIIYFATAIDFGLDK